MQKERQLNYIKSCISENSKKLNACGQMYENTSKKYQQKADEFAPNHIKVK